MFLPLVLCFFSLFPATQKILTDQMSNESQEMTGIDEWFHMQIEND